MLKKILFNWEKYLMIVLFSMMVVLIFVMTISRITALFTDKLIWAEECARYMMIWMAFVGIGPAAIDHLHFRLTAIAESFQGKTRKTIDMTAVVLTILILSAGIYYGGRMVHRIFVTGQTSPVMMCPMWIPYLSIPLGLTDMLIRTLVREFIKKPSFK